MKKKLHPNTRATLEALQEGTALSRNRNYELYEDPLVKRGVRIHRYLEQLAEQVTAHPEQVQLSLLEDDRYMLSLNFPEAHGQRRAYLSLYELQLLSKRHPSVAQLIEGQGSAP